jgi:ribosome biogenesis protein ENP2
MDLRLYNRVKTASEPHAYEKYVQNQVTSKIDAKRANRITVSKRLPGVNKDLAQLLLNQPKQKRELQDFDGDGQADKAQGMISNPLGDDRFGDMFTRPEYQIDTESFEFQRLNPNKNHRFKNVAGAESDNEDRSSDNEEAAKPRSDSRFERADKEDDSDTDDDIVYRKDGKSSSLLMGKISKQKAKEAARGGNDEDEEEEEGEGAGSSLYPSKRRKPSMFQLKRGVDLDGLAANVPLIYYL